MHINHTPYDKEITLVCYTEAEGTLTFSVYSHNGSKYCNVFSSAMNHSLIGIPVEMFLQGDVNKYYHDNTSLGEKLTFIKEDPYTYVVTFEIEGNSSTMKVPTSEVNSLVRHFKHCKDIKIKCDKVFKKENCFIKFIKGVYFYPTKLLKL